jgi:hypothetical protein
MGRDHFGDLKVDKPILLKYHLNKWKGKDRIHLTQHGTCGGLSNGHM